MKKRPTLKQIGNAGQSTAFWNCRLNLIEWLLLAAAFNVALALHLTPVLAAGLGNYLIILMAVICFCSPFTGFFFIGCCSVLPFGDAMANEIIRTVGLTTTAAEVGPAPAKIGIYVWGIMTIVRYRRFSLKGWTELWPVLPWLVWYMILSGEFVFMPTSEYVKALMFSLMACQLANEAKGEYLKCLMGLCLGALVVMVAYWGATAGLPIELSTYGGEREGIKRLGGVRADSVMVWPAILMGLSGFIGLSLTLGSRINPTKAPRWFYLMAGLLFVAAIPPLVATMTHGAYAGMGLLLAGSVVGLLLMITSGILTGTQTTLIGIGTAFVVGIVLWLFSTNALDMKTRSEALLQNYETQSEDEGLAASRTGVWTDSINTIMQHPLMGIKGSGSTEKITSEYSNTGYYLSHNVFLDYGRVLGIPGMLLLAFFFFYPAIKVFQSGNWIRFFPFLMVNFAMFIFWISLSFEFYKTFWGLWMLMVLAASRTPQRPHAASTRHKLNPE